MHNSQPKRHWFQVSLRTLFVLILVIAAYFAGLATAQRRAERAIQHARQAAEQEAEARMQASRQAEELAKIAEAEAKKQAELAQLVDFLRKIDPDRTAAEKKEVEALLGKVRAAAAK